LSLDAVAAQTLVRMQEKYLGWEMLSAAERRLLVMAYLADEVKVREVGGNNRGVWVSRFLLSVGLDPGYPWCAASLAFASSVADAPCPTRPDYNPAAVLGWWRWADDLGVLVSSPRRGDIAMRRTSATTGHIGVVVRVVGPMVYSIEGNTSPGDSGSQADGGGLYRRVRLKSFWSWGFARA
jgi:hypothetical protein